MLPALAALLTFVAASVTTALLFVLPAHEGLHRHVAIVSLTVGTLAGVIAFSHARTLPANRLSTTPRTPLSPWAWLVFAAFALFALREFGFLVYYNGDRLDVGSPNNLGDISLHMQLARYFANGARWWPDHPEITGQPLRYYPGVDLFHSLFLILHNDERLSLTWVSLVGAAATAAALYRWGGTFTVAGFLFSGGLAGFRFLNHAELIDFQATLGWKSLPLAIFVTQRPFLYALPAGLLLLIHWRAKFFPDPTSKIPRGGVLPFWVELLLYATLPIFHLFAFVFVSLLLGWWFAVYFYRPPLRWHIGKLVALALVPATIQVALMTANFSATGGKSVWLEPGWMAHGKPALQWVAFWMLNFGGWAILAVALWAHCIVQAGINKPVPHAAEAADDAAVAFVVPAGLVFVMACIIMVAVWDWDNTKIMLWAYVAALPFIWQVWIKPLTMPLRAGLCILLFFSGGISLLGGMTHGQMNFGLLQRAELDGVRRAMKGLPVDGRFASSPDYNHPLVYCGRKLAVGYDGHLYSQGIDYSAATQELSDLMTGKPDWRDAAKKLDVRYVYWGEREEKKFAGSTQPWAANDARPVARGSWGRIYDLGAPAAGK